MSRPRFRRLLLQALLLLAALPLAALAAPPAPVTVTVTDITGREVQVPARVARIVLGEGRLFHALALLEDPADPFARIAAWQGDFRRLDPQTYAQYRARFPHVDDIPLIGNTSEDTVSTENVLQVAPDLAIFSISGHGPGKDNPIVGHLQRAGIPVVFVDFREHPLTNTAPSMRLLGKVLDREVRAARFIGFYEEALRQVAAIAKTIPEGERPKVFLDLRAGAFPQPATAGEGSLGEMVELAGGINVGNELTPNPLGPTNVEAVLVQDPDVYIATGAASEGAVGVRFGPGTTPAQSLRSLRPLMQRDPLLAALRPVRAGEGHAFWHHFYNTPYHVVLVQQMAVWLHPERFAALDPDALWQRLYDYLPVEPSGSYWTSTVDEPAG